MKPNHDIIEAATNAGKFQVFIGAVAETGLGESLKEPGPYTIFAPTDEAFAKVPKAKMDKLLRPENKGALELLLKNHIVFGDLMADELKRLDIAKTAKGEDVRIDSRDGLRVRDALVLLPDIEASNGVLHGIDTVLIPLDYGAAAA
jgi:uncharacterized surface protein with fasciclin (FAS1) repeats